jgi:hypothetical protein
MFVLLNHWSQKRVAAAKGLQSDEMKRHVLRRLRPNCPLGFFFPKAVRCQTHQQPAQALGGIWFLQ